MQVLGMQQRSEASLELLTGDVVKSWAIEGEELNADEVRSSIARHLGMDQAGLPPVGRAIEGVVEMMLDATGRFDRELTPERLFDWHTRLFPKDQRRLERVRVGGWRLPESDPMQVISGRAGHQRVHFEAPAAARIEEEMQNFLRWFNGSQQGDPVLLAGIAHLWFLTVHPFEDGNGRIARAIGDMALARADGTKERYYSLSTQIESERKDYYLRLEQTQRGDLDATEWLLWFLGILDRAIESAEHILGKVFHKALIWQRAAEHSLNERQRKVLGRLLDDFKGHLTSSKYAKLSACSTDTALRDIRQLLSYGLLIQNQAGGRSTSYRLAD
ncbi:MAG: Fic family protein [Planctomycetota bacterium]|jgi:Fic family protein